MARQWSCRSFTTKDSLLPRQTSTSLSRTMIPPMVNVKLLLICTSLCLGLLASSARASCGDYLKKKDPSSTSADNPITMPGEQMPSDHGSPFQPCSGPGCSNGKLPPLTPPAPRLVESDQLAWSMTRPSKLHPEPTLFLLSSASTDPVRRTEKIFHPPR